MTLPSTQTEDEYQGRTKCNVCGHKEDQHRFAHDCCLVKDCDCLAYRKKGGLK
jgi:hypothetical protein